MFRGALGQEPWTLWDPGPGVLFNVCFVTRGPDLFAILVTGAGSVLVLSRDDGGERPPARPTELRDRGTAAGLGPGVYHARLTANGGQRVVRLVRAR